MCTRLRPLTQRNLLEAVKTLCHAVEGYALHLRKVGVRSARHPSYDSTGSTKPRTALIMILVGLA